jgi:hypothetical protein
MLVSLTAVVVAGLAVLGIILAARWVQAWVWRQQLVAYHLELPRRLTRDQEDDWLAALGAATRHIPAVIEIMATKGKISHYMTVPRFHAHMLLSQARSMLPGVRVEEVSDYLVDQATIRAAGELRLTSTSHPLGQERAIATSGALLSASNRWAVVKRFVSLCCWLARPPPIRSG